MLFTQNAFPPQADLRHLAKKIHSLGPFALGHLFAELAGGKPLMPVLEAYAVLEPLAGFIHEHIAKAPNCSEVLQ